MKASSQQLQETIFGLLRAIKGFMREAIRAEGLALSPMHFLMMKYVKQTADCTALHLAEATQRDKAQVTRLLKDLTAQGLLEKSENPGDRRSSLLSLSAEGEACYRRLAAAEEHALAQLSRGVSRKDLALFVELGQRMLANSSAP